MATLIVNDTTPRLQYVAAAGQTVFAYDFAIFEVGDLKVYLTPTGSSADDNTDIIVINVDYSVSGAGNTTGGNVTLTVGATAGDIITIERDLAVKRTIDYQNLGDLLSETFNDDFDKLIMMVQQNETQVSRAMRLNTTEPNVTDTTLPNPQAGLSIVWNNSGTGLINGVAPGGITSSQRTEPTKLTMVSSTTGAIGDIVETAGYRTEGDGGGNRYIYEAIGAAADGGSRIDLPNTTPPVQARGLFPNGKYYLKQWGAVGDDSEDDDTAIQNAKAFCESKGAGTELICDRGIYLYTTPFLMDTVPFWLLGTGSAHPAYQGAPVTYGTTFKYNGVAGGTAFKFGSIQASHGMKNISVDCNNLAATGIHLEGAKYGVYEDISVRNQTAEALFLGATNAASTNWNTFRTLSLDATGNGRTGLRFSGTGVGNSAHNNFYNTQINHSGTGIGIYLGYCDNNVMVGTYINRLSGTGAGVLATTIENVLFPESNYFYHLQAGNGGWVNEFSNVPINYIFGYDQSNGQPLPVLNGGRLFYTAGLNMVVDGQPFLKDLNIFTAYTPVVTSTVGAITTVGASTGRYLERGKLVYFNIDINITTNGTGSGQVNITLPIPPGTSVGGAYIIAGRTAQASSYSVYGTTVQGTLDMVVSKYDGAYPGIDGQEIILSGFYEIN